MRYLARRRLILSMKWVVGVVLVVVVVVLFVL